MDRNLLVSLIILLVLAVLMAALTIFLRRRIAYNSTHFKRAGPDADPINPSPSQSWTLAIVARYLMEVELPVDSFRIVGFRRTGALQPMLANDWKIHDRAGLFAQIKELQIIGHRERFAEAMRRPASHFLAWDLMRAILLAWAGANLDWITPAEFASVLLDIGPELQNAFNDWPEAAASYELGLRAWASEVKRPQLAERANLTLRTLLNDPASPWKAVPWRTPLTATMAG